MTATLSNRGDAMPRLASLLDQVGRDFQVPADVLTDLRIALDEIVSNVIKYAYTDGASHDFTIQFAIRDGRLETTIEDEGVAFNPLLAADPDVTLPLESRRPGGLGVHFVKNLMNAVSYERVEGRNRLTLGQNLGEERG